MPTVYTEVEVDVDLVDFDTDDLFNGVHHVCASLVVLYVLLQCNG